MCAGLPVTPATAKSTKQKAQDQTGGTTSAASLTLASSQAAPWQALADMWEHTTPLVNIVVKL
jgi:hypothetical protein